MQKYEKPEAEVIRFEEDIIRTSGDTDTEDDYFFTTSRRMFNLF